MTFTDMVEYLARKGEGVAWNPIYKEFRPFSVQDGECIIWWHDPEDIANENFIIAVRSLYNHVKE